MLLTAVAMSERLIGALTEEVYEAATGGMPWTSFGEGLVRLVEARTASLFLVNPAEGEDEIVFRGGLPDEAVEPYRRHYRSVDLWTSRAAAATARRGTSAAPVVWISGMLVSDDEYVGSEFYNDFGRALGLRHVVGTVLSLGRAGLMPIGLHRGDRDAPFEAEQARQLESLFPHLRRAMQLRHRLRTECHAESPGRAVLDALTEGVLVVDAELRVLVANAAAEAMAAGGRVIHLGRSGEGGTTLLRIHDHRAREPLTTCVRATARGGPGGAVALHDEEGVAVAAALVYPLPRRFAESADGLAGRVPGRALVLLRDLRRLGAIDPEYLRSLFGLTRAEAEVALGLAGGSTKSTVARLRGSQVSTVNTQVRSILAKTGTANLRDLERLLGGLRSR